jgi:hypothetical protein
VRTGIKPDPFNVVDDETENCIYEREVGIIGRSKSLWLPEHAESIAAEVSERGS